jgi:hypothetical protein
MARVQIPAYTDRWMMGDRYGEIIKITRARLLRAKDPNGREIAHVKLDKSGKTLRFMLDDCTVLA